MKAKRKAPAAGRLKKKDLRAPRKRGLITRAEATAAVVATAKPKKGNGPSPEASAKPASDGGEKPMGETQAWKLFRGYHGDCAVCHGEDVNCWQLGMYMSKDGFRHFNTAWDAGPLGLAHQMLRRLEWERRLHASMPPEVKERLRARAAEKRASRPPRVVRPVPVARDGGAFPFGTKVRYVGGSRAGWLEVGQEGVVTRHFGTRTLRYGVRFGSRATVLAADYVQAVG